MDKRFSLLDLFTLFLRQKKRILIHFVVVAALAVAVSYLIPKKYKAEALFLPPHDETIAGGISLGAMLNMGRTSAFTPQQVHSILRSRRVQEAVIREFDLIRVYKKHREPNPTEQAMKTLRGRTTIRPVTQTGLTQSAIVHYAFSVIDRDSVRAADMANFMLEELDRAMDELTKSQSAYTLEFVTGRLDSISAQKLEAMAALAEFQTANRIYSPQISQQIVASVGTYAELQKQKLMSEIQRELLLFERGPESRDVRFEDKKIRELEARMRDLETRREPSVMPGLEHSVELSHQFLKLYQESEVLVRLELLMRQQYEEARIKNARLAPSVRVVDPAVPPEWKNSPKKAIIVIVIVGVYMLGLFVFILASHGISRATPETRRKLDEFREALRFRAG